MSDAGDPQSAISSVQQFPIAVFYLGWFLRPRYGVPLAVVTTATFAVMLANNPLFQTGGLIGPTVEVHALTILILCFLAGSYLWHRNAALANTDQLTGVRTRGAFFAELDKRLRSRSELPNVVIALDLDGLKRLNDTVGHDAGGRALIESMRSWRSVLARGTTIGRLGGDEFAVLLDGENAEGAASVADRLHSTATYRWSSGIAVAQQGESAEALMKRADEALYLAKRRRGDSSEEECPDEEPPTQPAHRFRCCGPVTSRMAQWSSKQSQFSIMSSLLPFVLVLVFVADLIFSHPHMRKGQVITWVVVYGFLAVVPLVMGARFPRWAGFVMVLVIMVWSSFWLVTSQHAHSDVNALLQLPLVALYIGWFYKTSLALVFFGLSIVRLWVAVWGDPGRIGDVATPVIVAGYAVLVGVFCFLGARVAQRQIQTQLLTDHLTGVANRRGLSALATKFVNKAAFQSAPVSVILIDFDNFKAINDTGGHEAGDAVLASEARRLGGLVSARVGGVGPGGIIGRIGGDEFILVRRGIVTDTQSELRRLREEGTCSWTWGVVRLRRGEDLSDAVARAGVEMRRTRAARRPTALSEGGEGNVG